MSRQSRKVRGVAHFTRLLTASLSCKSGAMSSSPASGFCRAYPRAGCDAHRYSLSSAARSRFHFVPLTAWGLRSRRRRQTLYRRRSCPLASAQSMCLELRYASQSRRSFAYDIRLAALSVPKVGDVKKWVSRSSISPPGETRIGVPGAMSLRRSFVDVSQF